MSRYYSVLVITVVVINGLHCTTMYLYYSKSVSYLSNFPCLSKKQCNLLQTVLISCFYN